MKEHSSCLQITLLEEVTQEDDDNDTDSLSGCRGLV